MNRLSCFLALFLALNLTAASSFAASSIQGWMTSEGVTGRPGSPPHKWDREIVYVSPAGSGGITAGMRMLAMEPGWFFLQPPGGFPAGRYTMFSINMGSIDGGSVGFDYEPTSIEVPAGSGAIENLQFRTHGHYSVMYNQNYTEWAAEPWIWGTDFYQTFTATSTAVTRVATKLAGKAGDHYWMYLNFAVYRTNAGPPSSWPRISPIRERYLSGGTDPIIHIFDVNYLSSEVPLVPGEQYAVRFWRRPDSQSESFAIVARPDNGTGYASGQAYGGDTPYANWDLYGYVTGGAPNTLVNFGPTDQGKPMNDALLGWTDIPGQTFQASGNGLAAVELLYTVGLSPNPSLPITIRLLTGFGGAQIGPAKTCWTVTDLAQGRAAAYWEPGEVPLTPGQTYYLEFDATDAGGVNVWGMSNDIPNVGAYIGENSVAPVDLPLTIAEYVSGDIPTPLPTNTRASTPTFTSTPTPIAGENLLLNGDMESGVTGTSGQAPDHWTKWTGSGSPSFWYNDAYGRNNTRAPRVIGGAINQTVFDAGWYQRVTGLTPGDEYGLFGWVRIVPGLTSEYEAWIGYDLTGQTSNGLAGTVHYTKIGGYPGFAQLPLQQFVAAGDSVTVWLRARNTSQAEVFYADFDDMMLYEISPPPNTPTAAATPTPPATPIPGTDLLLNGDMEQGEPGTSGHVPDYWTTWTGSGSPTFWYNTDCGHNWTLGARVIGGAINQTTFDAGLYQRVNGIVPGARYGLTGWVRVAPALTPEYEAWIGYDLTGQTSNGLAGTVHYTRTGGDYEYAQMPLQEFVATGSSVTVWLRARNTSQADIFYGDFDDMFLSMLEPAEPTETPPPSATLTPTPLLTPTRTPVPPPVKSSVHVY